MEFNIFAGERPIISANNLPVQNASLCRDCYLHSSGVDPLKSALAVGVGYDLAETLFKSGSKLIKMDQHTCFVRSPIIKDKFERIYYTNDTGGLFVTTWNDLVDNVVGVDLSAFKAPAAEITATVERDQSKLTTVYVRVIYPDGDVAAEGEENVDVFHTGWVNFDYAKGVDKVKITFPGAVSEMNGIAVYGDGKVYAQVYDDSRFAGVGVDLYEFEPSYANEITSTSTYAPEVGLPVFEVVAGSDNIKETTFVVTYVSVRDEESGPSPASKLIEYEDGVDSVTIDLPATVNADIEFMRVYMAIEGEFFCLQDKIPATQAQLVVDVLDDDLNKRREASGDAESLIGAGLTTNTYFHAPDDLQGLIELPNGCLAGFTLDDTTGGKVTGTVHVSEPYQPHAWPIEYRWKVNYKIISLAKVPEGFLALVKGRHSLITGSTPDLMNENVLETQQSCRTREGVQEIGGTVVWDSPDGLAIYGGGAISVVSTDVWSREQWSELSEGGVKLGQYEGRLLIYPNDSDEGILYDLSRHDIVKLSEGGVTALLYDVEEDDLYQVRSGELAMFNQGAPLNTAEWISKPIVITGAKPFKAGRLDIEGLVILSLYKGDNALSSADGVAVPFWSKPKMNMMPFRVGSSQRKRSLSVGFKLVGSDRLRGFELVRDMRELR